MRGKWIAINRGVMEFVSMRLGTVALDICLADGMIRTHYSRGKYINYPALLPLSVELRR
jgi:hypothetical protein